MMGFDQAIVGYLPEETTEEDLKTIFKDYGNINCLYLFVKFEPLRNFAHIQFDDENSASRAFRAGRSEGISFNGTILTVTQISNNYAPIKMLPVPCLIQILSKLPPVEKLASEEVCSHWKQYAPLLWITKKIFHEKEESNNHSKMSETQFHKCILASGPCLEDIDCYITNEKRLSLIKDLCVNVETMVLDFNAPARQSRISGGALLRRMFRPLRNGGQHQNPRRRDAADEIFNQNPQQNPEMHGLLGREFRMPIIDRIPAPNPQIRENFQRRLERLRPQDIIGEGNINQGGGFPINEGLEALVRPQHQNPQVLIRPQQQNPQRDEGFEQLFIRFAQQNPLRPGLGDGHRPNVRPQGLLIPLDPPLQRVIPVRRRQGANPAHPFEFLFADADVQPEKKMSKFYDDLSAMFDKQKGLKRIALKDIDEEKKYDMINHLTEDLFELHLFVGQIFKRRVAQRVQSEIDLQKFRFLRALTLNGFKFRKNSLKGFGDLMNLTYLRLEACSIDSKTLEGLKEFMKLRYLSIPALNITDKILYYVARKNANLKFLNINDNPAITDISLRGVFALPDLRELRMENVREAMLGFLEDDAQPMEHFKTLHCPNCRNLGDDSLVKLIELSPKLQVLNVAKCDITNEFFDQVQQVTKKRDNAVSLKLFAGYTTPPDYLQIEAASNLIISAESVSFEHPYTWNGFYYSESLE